MSAKRCVTIGFVGATLDFVGKGAKRWEGWRPSVALCQHDDLLVGRFELLYQDRFRAVAEQVRDDIANVSPETKVVLRPLELRDPWDFEEVYGALLDFALKYEWDIEREEYLLHITTGTHVAQICMFLLAEARYLPARLLQTSPPTGEKREPCGTYKIIDLDLSKYDGIMSRFNKKRRDDLSFLKSGIATRNKRFNSLIERIERVAINSREPILLLGPTGAGKSRLARRIFELKRERKQVSGDFVDVNCATIRGDGAMSTLFGHVRGAFTGAANARDGLLLAADGGILFLDEIGELGLDEQAMLLRAIEQRTFLPVGSDREVKSDFQLIAGTNRDLQRAVREGTFREDLLARINLWCFTLPGLSERPEDIEPNLDYELERYAQRNNTRVTFNKEARDAFLSFASSSEAKWRANFRDLNSAVVRMATLADGGRVSRDIVDEEIERLKESWGEGDAAGAPDEESLLEYFEITPGRMEEIDPFDRVQLLEVLRTCRAAGSMAEAGRRLFAVSRRGKTSSNDADRVRKYLARFGVRWSSRVRVDAV